MDLSNLKPAEGSVHSEKELPEDKAPDMAVLVHVVIRGLNLVRVIPEKSDSKEAKCHCNAAYLKTASIILTASNTKALIFQHCNVFLKRKASAKLI